MTEQQAQEFNGHRNGVNVFNAAKLADSDMWAVHSNAINEFPELDLSEFEGVEDVEFEEGV
jgi:hypothetical protein